MISHVPGSPTAGANDNSFQPRISADGRWVAFTSKATDLVAGQVDGNGDSDVFLWDRVGDTTQLVSRSGAGPLVTGNHFANQPVISDDGRYVAFESSASDLMSGGADPNAASDVFVFDRLAGIRLVSHVPASPVIAGNFFADRPTMSGDGRFIAFDSSATDLVSGLADLDGEEDVFLWDRDAPTASSTVLVSHVLGIAFATGDRGSLIPRISADGGVVAYETRATNLVTPPGSDADTNDDTDVIAYDRLTATNTLVSHTALEATTTANFSSSIVAVSADGAFVLFLSGATDVVAAQADTNGASDLFLWSRQLDASQLVSHSTSGARTAGNGGSNSEAAITPDGGLVAFTSSASDLIASDANGSRDVFLFERQTAAISLVSHAAGHPTQPANDDSESPALADGGRVIGFSSLASNVVTADGNGVFDVFAASNGVLVDGFETGTLNAWSAATPP